MEQVLSGDGTRIAFHRRGEGPALILVAGTGAANPVAWPATALLEQHFTVYAMDRRGRGASGDGPSYAIEREFEDIAAVVDSTGGPAAVLGHSFGGLLALEAALLTQNVSELVVYEPWVVQQGARLYPEGFVDRLEAMVEAGDREGVLVTHYAEDAGLMPEQIRQLKESPAWPERLATAHTLPREMRAEERYRFHARRFRELQIPVLFLLGADSTPEFVRATEMVRAALPDARVEVLPGQQHLAMYSAPELFAAEVIAFLTGARWRV